MNSNPILPGEIFLLVSFIPMVIIIARENYSFSPGFTKHYNKMIEKSPIALLVLDRDFVIIEMSDRATNWFKGDKNDPIHQVLGSDENAMEMMKLLTVLQMHHEINDYRMTMCYEETEVHFSIIASIIEVEDQYYYYLLVRDVTNEHEQEQMIFHLAYHDVLTNLYNRTYFTEKMETIFDSKAGGALILSDLNFFKQINDTYGHQLGDEVLKHAAEVFEGQIIEPNIVARLGGDEFIFYLTEVDEMEVQKLIEKVRVQFIRRPFVKGDIVIEVIPSFGYAMITDDTDYDRAYHQADLAMYEDKREMKRKRPY